MKNYYITFFLFMHLMLSSCIGASPQPPTAYDSLNEMNHQGNRAYEQKDYAKALSFYTQALKLSRSLDNPQSTTVNLINMAVVYRKLKNWDKANTLLEEAIALEGLSPGLLSEAQFQKALLYLDTNQPDQAYSWAEKSLASCNLSTDGESSKGARWNLLGRIALLKSNHQDASGLAAKGLEQSKQYKVPAEEANAYRLMAEIKAKQKDFQAAKDLYHKVLAMDKTLGQSGKILLDLNGLAEVFALEGNQKEAAKYYQRAYEVAKNSGEEEEAQLILQKLGLVRRQKNQSEP